MAVQLIEEVVKVPKEINDVRTLIVSIVKDAKAGKSVVDIGSGNLQKLIDAVKDVDLVDDEVREALPESVACVCLMGQDIIRALVAAPVAP